MFYFACNKYNFKELLFFMNFIKIFAKKMDEVVIIYNILLKSHYFPPIFPHFI